MQPSPLIPIARQLSRKLSALRWHTPSHVYNPLEYAWSGHRMYLERYGTQTGRVLLVGMNPGPWGMAQTGVPFGNVSSVREWFGIDARLSRKLPAQHPKYPILGLACGRDEGSGKRLWGWAQSRLGTPGHFFERFFIWNYCPLLFLAKGRNLTPGQLAADEAGALDAACDIALERAIAVLRPAAIVGIGRYAEQRVRACAAAGVPTAYLPHPSPANPAANQRWPELAEHALAAWLPLPEPTARRKPRPRR